MANHDQYFQDLAELKRLAADTPIEPLAAAGVMLKAQLLLSVRDWLREMPREEAVTLVDASPAHLWDMARKGAVR